MTALSDEQSHLTLTLYKRNRRHHQPSGWQQEKWASFPGELDGF